jgi:uncharacterized protein (TIGR02271 family)
MRLETGRIRPGLTARSTKGEKLGKIIRVDEEGFIVEKGVFFHKDYQLYHEYVTELRGDEVIYALDDAKLGRRELTDAERAPTAKQGNVETLRTGGAREVTAAGTAGAAGTIGAKLSEAKAKIEAKLDRRPGSEAASERLLETDGEMRIPVMDEEIDVQKVAREAGHVRIRKQVRLEERHVTVPVRREEVVIERLPGREATAATIGAEAFKEQTVDLPVIEEELRVSKHPVVREELRVRRIAHEEQREAAATLRHEEVDVEDTTPSGRRLGRDESKLSAAAREAGFKKA